MTKEAEHTELHRTIWLIANDLRGSVDGWDFKAYVRGMLFYRFISENLTTYLNDAERCAGNPDFDSAIPKRRIGFWFSTTIDIKRRGLPTVTGFRYYPTLSSRYPVMPPAPSPSIGIRSRLAMVYRRRCSWPKIERDDRIHISGRDGSE
ncbi:MAG: type I restriction-modification system subunit M N-terminal domain-containing protein [Pseudonocardiaceae bacterium]